MPVRLRAEHLMVSLMPVAEPAQLRAAIVSGSLVGSVEV